MRNVLIAGAVCLWAAAQSCVFAEDGILLRPQAGVGGLDNKVYRHAGMRILLDASSSKKYGLELTRIDSAQGDYVAAGIVLEQKLYGWFNASIGTIGYFGRSKATPNVPGLVANLGWEPETQGAFRPFVTLRNDILFADKTRAGTALSAGVSVKF